MSCTWPRFKMDRGEPCGPTNSTATDVPCCARGDICVSNSICRFTHSLEGGSGYYAAGCTDEDFGTTACAKRCDKIGWPDIVYDESSKTWKCCGADEDMRRNCDDPTDDSFLAPPPGELIDFWTAGQTNIPWTTATASATSSSTSISSTPSTSTSTSTSASNSAPASTESVSPSLSEEEGGESGLSTGAKAGIGVGAAIGGLLLIIALVLWLLKRKQRQKSAAMPIIPIKEPPPPQPYNDEQTYHDKYYGLPTELPAGDRPAVSELDVSK